jgi:multiple sugar transport system substrate-binding protein
VCTLRVFSLLALTVAALSLFSCQKRAVEQPKPPDQTSPFVFLASPASKITFLSTQMNPVEEAGKMRNVILKDFRGFVDFRPNDSSYTFMQIDEILKTDPSAALLVGATHGDLVTLYEKGALRPLDSLLSSLSSREFQPTLVSLSKIGGKGTYYIPWTQATYVMVASKKAMKYLPKGIDPQALTYGQLELWAARIFEKTGMKAIGFPAGKNGLMHRFFQGYLYPSFTGSTLLKFKSAEAEAMWASFKGLWKYVNPGSLSYSTMAEPLLTGDVWIAWDHTARLVKAFAEKPDDFVAFPAPSGPRGLGYMAIIAGLAIPAGSGGSADAGLLIDYLTRPAIQARIMAETGFLPVVDLGRGAAAPRQLVSLKAAAERQAGAKKAVPTLAPIGLGELGSEYNGLFMLTFSEIVIEGKEIPRTLASNAQELQAIIDKANAECWLPDVSDRRPCRIE